MEENYYETEALIDPAIIFTIMALMGAIALIGIISQWRIFEKAGKPGWAAIIPIYNLYVHLKVVGKPGWWMLLLFIPLVNLYFAIKITYLLSKSFGKNIGFTLGLLFLPIPFFPILAFSSAKYQGPYGDPDAFAAYQESNRFEFENAAY
ncbi:MAG TPA: DUF5684 domain-containing protein [Flavisolibacter sp.]|jgi:magnesium-transporting ATPase (P-type)|nr:DUF5684 domain-containing protein [Flavisolibacter sp.]